MANVRARDQLGNKWAPTQHVLYVSLILAKAAKQNPLTGRRFSVASRCVFVDVIGIPFRRLPASTVN